MITKASRDEALMQCKVFIKGVEQFAKEVRIESGKFNLEFDDVKGGITGQFVEDQFLEVDLVLDIQSDPDHPQ